MRVKIINKWSPLLALPFVINCQFVNANDTAFGGSGALPVPIDQPDIQMVNEVIIIEGQNLNSSDMTGYWNYSCDFTFKNTLSKSLIVKMGFPFPINDGLSEVALPSGVKIKEGDPLVYNFIVTVNGQPVSSYKQKIAANQDKGMFYDDAYLWETNFPAQSTVKTHHTYSTGATYDAMGYQWVAYVLKTGGLWKDQTIGHTQLEVIPNTQTRLCTEINADADYLIVTPPGVTISGEGKDRRYTWDLPDFKPKDDLSLCLYTGISYVRHTVIYPLIQAPEEASKKLALMSEDERRILRNTIYAQYGRAFKSPDLQAYFNKQWWYEINPNYSDTMLTPEDQQLLSLIKK